MNMLLIACIVYLILGAVWFFISDMRINSPGIISKIPRLITFFAIWPFIVLVRVERAYRIGKFLKPHSKWHLIVKNKVVRTEDKEE